MWDSVPQLRSISECAIWVAFVTGIIAVAATLISSITANRASDIVRFASDARQRQAEVRIKANEAETASANEGAAKARLETEKLRAQFAWRTLTQAQFDRLVASLAAHKPELDGKSQIWYYSEPNSIQYSQIFRAAFDKAKITGVDYVPNSGKIFYYGVSIDESRFPKEARLIQDALRGAGVDATLVSFTDEVRSQLLWPGARVVLYISMKLPPH